MFVLEASSDRNIGLDQQTACTTTRRRALQAMRASRASQQSSAVHVEDSHGLYSEPRTKGSGQLPVKDMHVSAVAMWCSREKREHMGSRCQARINERG